RRVFQSTSLSPPLLALSTPFEASTKHARSDQRTAPNRATAEEAPAGFALQHAARGVEAYTRGLPRIHERNPPCADSLLPHPSPPSGRSPRRPRTRLAASCSLRRSPPRVSAPT